MRWRERQRRPGSASARWVIRKIGSSAIPGRTSPVVATLVALMSMPALAAEGVKIDDLVVASPLGDAQAATNLKAVRAFYDFWNTGDETLLKQAVAANFTDRTLPPGRPQGPEGPAFASRQFGRTAAGLRPPQQRLAAAGGIGGCGAQQLAQLRCRAGIEPAPGAAGQTRDLLERALGGVVVTFLKHEHRHLQ